MSAPITEVTEGRVTITANDTEANIREAAGFADPEPAESEKPAADAKPAETSDAAADERNPDGTFKAKAKAAEPEAKPADGDPRKSHQAKINQAIAKQREAERRADEAERRAQEAERRATDRDKPAEPSAQPQAPTPPATKPPTYLELIQRYQAHPDAPKLDDFIAANLDDPYSAHRDAMAAFVFDQRQAEREAQAQQRARLSRVDESVRLATEKYPELPQLMASANIVFPEGVIEMLRDEAAQNPESSADLLHHLLTHEDDARRLASVRSPIAAAREIGRLTAVLSSASSGPETVTTHTNAKPLIKPVRSSVVAPESSPPEDLAFGARYIAAMNEKERKAREAKRA